MSAVTDEERPVDWSWPCTLRDQMVIDALYPEVRASVERYIRSRGISGDPKDDDYKRGWEDGVEAMQDEVSHAHVPPPRVARPKRR